ncbi:hypothetical protein WJX73_000875 [Symbiochloris irregularis]|uniref:Uncharacterized protein n=1 Tax=Symbiochloris irregularis TaxID=706552 RepID=A0AAW1PZ42_9CHLO
MQKVHGHRQGEAVTGTKCCVMADRLPPERTSALDATDGHATSSQVGTPKATMPATQSLESARSATPALQTSPTPCADSVQLPLLPPLLIGGHPLDPDACLKTMCLEALRLQRVTTVASSMRLSSCPRWQILAACDCADGDSAAALRMILQGQIATFNKATSLLADKARTDGACQQDIDSLHMAEANSGVPSDYLHRLILHAGGDLIAALKKLAVLKGQLRAEASLSAAGGNGVVQKAAAPSASNNSRPSSPYRAPRRTPPRSPRLSSRQTPNAQGLKRRRLSPRGRYASIPVRRRRPLHRRRRNARVAMMDLEGGGPNRNARLAVLDGGGRMFYIQQLHRLDMRGSLDTADARDMPWGEWCRTGPPPQQLARRDDVIRLLIPIMRSVAVLVVHDGWSDVKIPDQGYRVVLALEEDALATLRLYRLFEEEWEEDILLGIDRP